MAAVCLIKVGVDGDRDNVYNTNVVIYDCMITRITTRLDESIVLKNGCFPPQAAQEIWIQVIYRFHEEYEIFFLELSLFLNCHENRKTHIYLYIILYFSFVTIRHFCTSRIFGGVHKSLLFLQRQLYFIKIFWYINTYFIINRTMFMDNRKYNLAITYILFIEKRFRYTHCFSYYFITNTTNKTEIENVANCIN